MSLGAWKALERHPVWEVGIILRLLKIVKETNYWLCSHPGTLWDVEKNRLQEAYSDSLLLLAWCWRSWMWTANCPRVKLNRTDFKQTKTQMGSLQLDDFVAGWVGGKWKRQQRMGHMCGKILGSSLLMTQTRQSMLFWVIVCPRGNMSHVCRKVLLNSAVIASSWSDLCLWSV